MYQYLNDHLQLQDLCLNLINDNLINSAHDVSDGGIAVAIAECIISSRSSLGAEVFIDSNLNGVWDGDEYLIDNNGDGIWNAGESSEYFEDWNSN